MNTSPEIKPAPALRHAAHDPALEAEVAGLLVATLHLEIAADEIEPEAPLFGEGLGLDSIDALELALAVSREYGLELKSDEDRNRAVFASLRALAGHIGAHRTRPAGAPRPP